jgi:hypothetical protein
MYGTGQNRKKSTERKKGYNVAKYGKHAWKEANIKV